MGPGEPPNGVVNVNRSPIHPKSSRSMWWWVFPQKGQLRAKFFVHIVSPWILGIRTRHTIRLQVSSSEFRVNP